MKSAFIRSKQNVKALVDDQQSAPNEYAVDEAELAADDLIHDAANMAASGTKTTVRLGRRLFQRQWEKRTAKSTGKTRPPPNSPTPLSRARAQTWRGVCPSEGPIRSRIASAYYGMDARWSICQPIPG